MEAASSSRLVVTGFGGAATRDEPVKSRIKSWQKLKHDEANKVFKLKHRLQTLLTNPIPAVNAGVFA